MRYQMSAFVQPFQISPNVNELLAEQAAAEAILKNVRSRLSTEREHYIPQLRELITMFSFTEEDLFPKPEKKGGSDKDYNADYFYRDPETNEEWDGKGKRPAFLARKKKTDDFRIYHATGTKFAPVVKSAPAQTELATGSADVQSVPSLAVAPVAAAPSSEPTGTPSVITPQPDAASIPDIVEHPATALHASAGAVTS
jgi:DNA-binding protein H-NS